MSDTRIYNAVITDNLEEGVEAARYYGPDCGLWRTVARVEIEERAGHHNRRITFTNGDATYATKRTRWQVRR